MFKLEFTYEYWVPIDYLTALETPIATGAITSGNQDKYFIDISHKDNSEEAYNCYQYDSYEIVDLTSHETP